VIRPGINSKVYGKSIDKYDKIVLMEVKNIMKYVKYIND
jgi:hypothetical protein